jgi:predicted GNAT family N-acyltransferase
MTGTDANIRATSWQADQPALEQIYQSVFVEEQAVPREIALDGSELEATHFLVERDGEAVGCGRLLDSGQIGRMAVLPALRSGGLGGQLLRAIIAHARQLGMQRVFLHAQKPAIGFYRDHGFSGLGDEFTEAGIPHLLMELALESQVVAVAYPEPFASLCVEMTKAARRSVRIFSPQLDHDVFDRSELASALAEVARGSRYGEVRILISDSRPMVKRGHRLLDLSRRLSSSVTIQKLSAHPELPSDSFVLSDDRGTLFKPNDSDRDGFYDPESRTRAKPYIDKFDELWLKSRPDPELRVLGL